VLREELKMPASNNDASSNIPFCWGMTWLSVIIYLLFFFIIMAYTIRLQAIDEYGTVIHEFDPYFNYRATEYLYNNGAKKFFTWFDYKSWYPLGRPVGSTIYPGMQFTAVWIKRYIVGDRMSLNDVCCYIPAWFGAITSFLVGCIAYECSLECNSGTNIVSLLWGLFSGKKSKVKMGSGTEIIFGLSSPAAECGIFATGIMAIVPAHLMRSVGGGFDNESVALTAMASTFYLWIRSLRTFDNRSHLYGILAGVSYFYMAAVWGGYIFVINLIGLHAVTLVLIGRFSTKVYLSYSLFYSLGTLLAIQIPVIGLSPLKSLEQLGPFVVFVVYQIIQFTEVQIRNKKIGRLDSWKYRGRVFGAAFLVGLLFIAVLTPHGYFGPVSSRIRGLFVKHTKTGNPLVDSVAEHQAADNKAFFRYLQHLCTFAPVGLLIVLCNLGDGPSFLITYAITAYYFSIKMVRLILIIAPIASILGGIAVGRIGSWCIYQLWDDEEDEAEKTQVNKKKGKKGVISLEGKKKKMTRKGNSSLLTPLASLDELGNSVTSSFKTAEGVLMKRFMAFIMICTMYLFALSFQDYSYKISAAMSNPSILMKARLRDGTEVIVDDYREAYHWIRDNTAEDSRIMAWWDYGYQITAIANRTTIADGNTWNHEHIALLGKILTTDIEEGYNIARHLADYVLLWTGGGGDDLAKSPHLARIANSVYRDLCPGDPTCRLFGMMDNQGTPSPMMQASFLYNLHGLGIKSDAVVDPTKFQPVFTSKYGKARVYKLLGVDEDSKSWAADPSNRICDVEGGWFCRGQYPPALKAVLSKKQDFAQLEDFNRDEGEDEDYQKQYFENLHNPEEARNNARMNSEETIRPDEERKPTEAEIDAISNRWEDTELTTLMWKIMKSGEVEKLEEVLQSNPIMAHMRSSDGRGPMWWAFESRKQDMVKVLMEYGVGHLDKDKYGQTPVDLLENH